MWERGPGREVREGRRNRAEVSSYSHIAGWRQKARKPLKYLFHYHVPWATSLQCKPSRSVGIHSCASLSFGGEIEVVMLVTNGKGWPVFSS